MSIHDLEDLERLLAGDGEQVGAGPDLARIHRLGGRRRTARRLKVGAGVATGVLATTAVVGPLLGDGTGRDGTTIADTAPPTTLSPLARRALEEIPGARRVSPWQVVIPAGDSGRADEPPVEDLVGSPAALPAHGYAGVTLFPRRAFPTWLHDGVLAHEERNAEADGSMAIGTTDLGVLVDVGGVSLGCLASQGEPLPGASCRPAVLADSPGGPVLEYALGTDDFLAPGAPMEVFLDEDYSTGRPTTLAIAGLDGADVARADFVTTGGEVVPGRVSGSIAEGDSLFWANVPGELATVVAYDADGDVIEDHPLRPCDDPVDCEVR